MNPALGKRRGAPHIVVKIRIAAVDDDVVRREQAGQRGNGRFGRLAGWHHHPDGTRRRERGGKRIKRWRTARPG